MGNNIFQYVFARIVHEETGLAMGIEDTGWPFENQEYFPNAIYKNGTVLSNLTYMEDLTNSDDFLDRVISQCKETGVILSGFYQNYKYYLPYTERIKEWLYTPVNSKFIPGDNDWIMHLRHEDYVGGNGVLGNSYYDSILNEHSKNIDKLYILGKDLLPEIVSYYQNKYNATIVNDTSINDFALIKSFKNIICANSTFSWWASFLSNADRIFVPKPKTGYWSDLDHQKLQIPGLHTVVEEV